MRLAERLGYSFVDTDKQIAEQYGMSVNKIFDHLGETTFRKSETYLLNDLISQENLVISTGGGLPCHGDNMDIINQHGLAIYLKASPDALYSRLLSRKHNRPLIKDLSEEELKAFIENTLSEREVYYNKARHVVRGLEENLDELVKLVGS